VKNRFKNFGLPVLLCGALTLGSCKTEYAYDMSSQDFVNQAASSNLFEIAAGNLARSSSDSTISAFGIRLIADYGTAERELTQLASQRNLNVPNTLGLLDQQNLDTLSTVTGSVFAQKFAAMTVASQGQAVLLFQAASGNNGVADANLRGYAAGRLPIIKADLQLAEQLPTTVIGK
jgi:putative membrane protein